MPMKIGGLVVSLLLMTRTANAVRGCTVIAIQPDLHWKKAVCDSDTSLLTKLPADLPNLLISLRVTQQLIRRLDDRELRRLVYLEEFYLDSCQLEHVHSDVFEGLNRLRILSLRNNSLRLDESGLLPATFYHLPALEILDLSENPLGRIPSNFFPSSLGKSLFELRLSHVKDEFPLSLEASTFAVLRNLQILDLSFCRLETLSSNFRPVFHRMERLRELQLGGNPWHCDCNLRWLREWYLSDTLPSMQLSYDQKTKFGTTNTITPTCKSPYVVKRRLIFSPSGRGAIEPEEFICKQWIDTKQKQISVVLGSNLSLSCQGYFEVRKNVQWFKDHLPLVTPSPNYVISQSISLDFIAYLNITRVRYEDGGIWECGLDDGGILQKASINVTVQQISVSGVASGMDEAQRQILVYVAIGSAIVFVLLAAIALTVFCYWGRLGSKKLSAISSCATPLQKNSIHSMGMSNSGEDARELIGTRVANDSPDSPVPIKNSSTTGSNSRAVNGINAKTAEKNHLISTKLVTTKYIVSTSLATSTTFCVSSPKLVSLTTATTTTAALTRPVSSTPNKQSMSPHSTALVATEFPSTSNISTNANCTDLCYQPISEGYGTVSLPSCLFNQITDAASSATIPSANNPFLVSGPCPIHGVNTRLQNNSNEQMVRTPIFDACPIHGSPVSVASRNITRRTASSFTQTPRHTAKSKSATSLRAVRNRTDTFCYHTGPAPRIQRKSLGSHQSSSPTQVQYRTLPSRISRNTPPFCPIHGLLMPSLLNRRSSSMSFDYRNQFSLRSRRTQSITLDVPYCSSCASTTSSDDEAVVGADFEDYSSDLTESPAVECTESGSSDYAVNSRLSFRKTSPTIPLNRTRFVEGRKCKDSSASSQEGAAETTPASVFSDDLTNDNNLSFNSDNQIQQHQPSLIAQTILGEPLMITARDSGDTNNAVLQRNLSIYERSGECLPKQLGSIRAPQKIVELHHHHSKQKEIIPSSSSSNLMIPKSILVKRSLHRKHRKRSFEIDY
ncbi:leucine rich repeat and fibronectin type III [Echinococcus multilocularis]|uniref:Leucine rich repeat and fibronectin type III n=1 Tax=Echinococcus multilocularis TaxID=6211 RepID=A0A068YEN1_ECHMU|nr:leucine rich repeat and fibronectin type III [Echinococcus multilocularis]